MSSVKTLTGAHALSTRVSLSSFSCRQPVLEGEEAEGMLTWLIGFFQTANLCMPFSLGCHPQS